MLCFDVLMRNVTLLLTCQEAGFMELIMYLAPAAVIEVDLWGLKPFTADVPSKIGNSASGINYSRTTQL